MPACCQQQYLGSKTLLQQNPQVFGFRVLLTQIDLFSIKYIMTLNQLLFVSIEVIFAADDNGGDYIFLIIGCTKL